MFKTQIIKNFLSKCTVQDLASLYTHDMECQVNVAQDEGDRVEGDFRGKKWRGYTDGITTWKSFRIPYKASSEPEYIDTDLTWDFEKHVEAIGLTGWNWKERKSLWVAFDFDALTGHSEKHQKKLTQDELDEIKNIAYNVPWINVRRSTSGLGLHFYVFLDPVPKLNHNEHAALARSVIGELSALTGYNFSNKVDICGGNMWIWHRKMRGTNGLELLKMHKEIYIPSPNWKDHIPVVKGKSRRTMPQVIPETEVDSFETLVSQKNKIPLDDDHKKVINYFKENGCMWWWDQDQHMCVTHTIHVKEVHVALGLKGFFETISEGKEKGVDHNCFLFPMRKGAWSVRRYTKGVKEHDSWDQDGLGWTRCYLNKDPDLRSACRAFGGIENEKGGFEFSEVESAKKAASLLGIFFDCNPAFNSRKALLKSHKDGRLIIEMEHLTTDVVDVNMCGWLATAKKWTYISNKSITNRDETEIECYDDIVRHLINYNNDDCGWTIRSGSEWRNEPLVHIRASLQSIGVGNKELNLIIGNSVMNCWKIVNIPFEKEYPGDRQWNLNAPQLKYNPLPDTENLIYNHWTLMLNHIGKNLDPEIQNNLWCKQNGIITGADYLKCWIASLFKEPYEPLPYLFLYGSEACGKSTFHESITLLLTKGCIKAESAISSTSNFNGEMEGSLLCVIEEIDLSTNKLAYNRMKDWVTSKELCIHRKNATPYNVLNMTHWIQCSNDRRYCPIFAGDTRIVSIEVSPLKEQISKKVLMEHLKKEAQDFITSVMNIELPVSPDRLNLPVVNTSEKTIIQSINKSELEIFIEDNCKPVPGNLIQFSEFYAKFVDYINSNRWSKIRVGRELPAQYPKGKDLRTNQIGICNIGWVEETYVERAPLHVRNGVIE